MPRNASSVLKALESLCYRQRRVLPPFSRILASMDSPSAQDSVFDDDFLLCGLSLPDLEIPSPPQASNDAEALLFQLLGSSLETPDPQISLDPIQALTESSRDSKFHNGEIQQSESEIKMKKEEKSIVINQAVAEAKAVFDDKVYPSTIYNESNMKKCKNEERSVPVAPQFSTVLASKVQESRTPTTSQGTSSEKTAGNSPSRSPPSLGQPLALPPRLRYSKGAAPSRYCHVCGRSAKTVSVALCGNNALGLCRKVVCDKCLLMHARAAARTPNNADWTCMHCRDECPPRARCHQYQRNNLKRRLRSAGNNAVLSGTKNSTAQLSLELDTNVLHEYQRASPPEAMEPSLEPPVLRGSIAELLAPPLKKERTGNSTVRSIVQFPPICLERENLGENLTRNSIQVDSQIAKSQMLPSLNQLKSPGDGISPVSIFEILPRSKSRESECKKS